jgi:hypothetical protein
MDNATLAWFGGMLTVVVSGFVLSLVGRSHTASTQPSAAKTDSGLDPIALQQQCLRLRAELEAQKAQLTTDFQVATFEQLQPLFTNYPSARKMAEAQPDLPARNLSALFTPLENVLADWHIDPIGTAWAQVPYDPQSHQPDCADLIPAEPVYIRFVGYRQGDRVLCPAKVSRTLPVQPQTH